MDNPPYTNDHDLLISLHTDMKTMKENLKEIKENTGRWVELIDKKVDRAELEKMLEEKNKAHEKFEKDIEGLKTWRYLTAGGLLVVIGTVIPLIIYIWQNKI